MNDDTIATVKSNGGHTMDLSFWIHQPPALSYFCVNCHRSPNSKPEDAVFEDEPHVIAAEGHFVVLRASFLSSSCKDEYFMYKAGDSESGKSASLDRLPLPDSFRLPNLKEFGIVPRGPSHYLLAALGIGFNKLYYQLHIYSSEHKTWRKIRLQNPRPRLDKVITSKVVTLGEGIIGWVDFQHGMLVCDLNETNPTAHYIPLPNPLPENKDKLEALQPGPSTRRFRDLVCINGVLKFIEMEQNVTITKVPIQEKVKVRNSDLIMTRECKAVDEKPKQMQSQNGWKAVVWTQSLSDDTWEMGDFVDAVDIVFDKSVHLSLLSGLKDEAELAFKDLYSIFPSLSTDGDDILYLKSVTKSSYPNGWMVAVDLRTKRVMAMGEYCLTKHYPSVKACGPCTLPQVTPGKVSVSACVSVKQTHSSAHELKNALISVGHPSSCESDNKHPRLLAEGIDHADNGAQRLSVISAGKVSASPCVSVKQAHSSAHELKNKSICAYHASSCESDNKRPRLSAEEVDRAHNRAQSILQNDHVSMFRPAQNNLLPQQCFIEHHTPYYPHRTNPPSQQYINRRDGPCNPGYAPMPRPPKLPEYSNYRPLLQHSQPSEQRVTHSSVFGPHQAPKPCFNYCEGTSYHGYSQQLFAPTSFIEGRYIQTGNRQLQLQHPSNVQGVW